MSSDLRTDMDELATALAKTAKDETADFKDRIDAFLEAVRASEVGRFIQKADCSWEPPTGAFTSHHPSICPTSPICPLYFPRLPAPSPPSRRATHQTQSNLIGPNQTRKHSHQISKLSKKFHDSRISRPPPLRFCFPSRRL